MCDARRQVAMARRLRPSVCAREDVLVRQGEVGLEMYVLSRGSIEIVASRSPGQLAGDAQPPPDQPWG
jgi:CRP-like cAMP-binding protein